MKKEILSTILGPNIYLVCYQSLFAVVAFDLNQYVC